jgi:hypothetical protein
MKKLETRRWLSCFDIRISTFELDLRIRTSSIELRLKANKNPVEDRSTGFFEFSD